MRTALLLMSTALVLTSCSKYQFFTLAGENISKNEKQEFVAENDTFRVIYDFHGDKGPIRVSIYNKSNKPMQVDCSRSAVIAGENSNGYYKNELKLEGEVERNRYNRYSPATI